MRFPLGTRTPALMLWLLALAVPAPARPETVPGGTRTAAPYWSAQATVEGGTVSVRWWNGPGKVDVAAVERREGDGAFVQVGSVEADDDGVFLYVDAAVRPGVTYAYRLAYEQGKDRQRTDAVVVTVPAGPGDPGGPGDPDPEPPPGQPGTFQLAIERVSPSPIPRLGRLTFTVPSPAPVLFEAFDPGGRRVLTRTLTVGAAGRAAIDVGPGLRTGVYLLRLTQAGVHATTRIVVLE